MKKKKGDLHMRLRNYLLEEEYTLTNRVFLTRKTNELFEVISWQDIDIETKTALQEYVKLKISDMSFLDNYKGESIISSFFTAFKHTIGIISSHSIRELCWSTLCADINVVNDMYFTVPSVKSCTKLMRVIVTEYYKYIAFLPLAKAYKICELLERKELLELKEKAPITNTSWSTFVKKQLFTNFPLDSRMNDVYIYQYPSGSVNEGTVDTTVYFKGCNTFLKQLLIEFIKSFPAVEKGNGGKARAAKIHYRQFFYYFASSLYSCNFREVKKQDIKFNKGIKSLLPECFQDFNFHVFNKQYRFYKMLDEKFCLLTKKEIVTKSGTTLKYDSTLDILKEFYIFLCRYITCNGISHNPFAGTAINADILVSPHFFKYYEPGFKFVYLSPFETMPKRNKWALILSKENNKASSSKQNLTSFDFTTVKDKNLRQDLKKFLWTYDKCTSIPNLAKMFAAIKLFLNLKFEYELANKKVINIHGSSLFSESFMLYYREHIIATYGNTVESNTAHIFSAVKIFLKYIQPKYRIPKNLLLYLQLKNLKREKIGGNPISSNDFDAIRKEITKLKTSSDASMLFFIIFNLAATTSLRVGEILNLERDCIVSIGENEGCIKYYAKTDIRNMKKRTLPLEKIQLIETAIKLTSELEKRASNEEKRYIFITKLQKFNRALDKVMVNQIDSKIINKQFKKVLRDSNIDENKYSVNHLRHTYKDTIWREGVRDGISTLVLEYMTDTVATTDTLNYRAKIDARKYAEMFSGVTISEVGIDGSILDNASIVDILNPVENGLGACTQNNCTKAIDEIKMFKCLSCDSFVTCVSRIPAFKRNIDDLKQKKENSTSEEEQNYYIAELKLNTAYYTELLALKAEGVKI
jgi:integrase